MALTGPETFRGYMSVLDILGFTDLMKARSPEWIYENVVKWLYETLDDLVDQHNLSTREDVLYTVDDGGYDTAFWDLDCMFFADTAVIYCQASDWDPHWAYLTLSGVLSEILELAFERHLLLRGAVSWGTFLVDRRLSAIVGKCVVDAHELELAQEWVGVTFCHGAICPEPDAEGMGVPDPKPNRHPYYVPDSRIVAYTVPRKSDPSASLLHWAIDWVVSRDRLHELLAGPGALRRKVQNTLEFMEWNERRRAEQGLPKAQKSARSRRKRLSHLDEQRALTADEVRRLSPGQIAYYNVERPNRYMFERRSDAWLGHYRDFPLFPKRDEDR